MFCVFVALKHHGFFNEAQLLQTTVLPAMYWFPMFYVLWAMKVTSNQFWGEQISEI